MVSPFQAEVRPWPASSRPLLSPPSSRSCIRAGFDGPWTVLIITEAGNCDQGYSFPIQISGGRVLSTGSANITGSVGRGGAVTVRVSQGGSSASGNGRLGATSGFGRWSGKGSAGTCSGRWQATRS